MKSLRTLRFAALAAAVAGAAVVSTPAVAGVSATAGVANLYLWRGQNLGAGTPVVSGSLDYSHDSGLFAGVWGSSAGPDQEVDLYAGYAYSSDAFNFKVTAYDYSYPRATVVGHGDLQEAVLSVSASGFFVDYIAGMGDLQDDYVDAGYTVGKFTGKVGYYMADASDSNYMHADLSYAFNERLAFTVSGIADYDDSSIFAGANKDALFVVSYTLPLELK